MLMIHSTYLGHLPSHLIGSSFVANPDTDSHPALESKSLVYSIH